MASWLVRPQSMYILLVISLEARIWTPSKGPRVVLFLPSTLAFMPNIAVTLSNNARIEQVDNSLGEDSLLKSPRSFAPRNC